MGKLSAMGEPTTLTQPSIPPDSVNEQYGTPCIILQTGTACSCMPQCSKSMSEGFSCGLG